MTHRPLLFATLASAARPCSSRAVARSGGHPERFALLCETKAQLVLGVGLDLSWIEKARVL